MKIKHSTGIKYYLRELPTKIIVILVFSGLLGLSSCQEPQARYPVQQRGATFLKESATRNAQLLQQEEKRIQNYIKADSLMHYIGSPHGFWYTYERKDTLSGELPEPLDRVSLIYAVSDLYGNSIYTPEETGILKTIVDRETPFPGLRQAIKIMRVKEKVRFLFPSGLAYGYKGDGEKIGANQTLLCTVELLTLEKNNQNLKSIQ